MLYKRDINSQKSKYIKDLFAPEDTTLRAVQKSISDNGLRPINVGAEEGKLLQILLKLAGAKTVVEVGTLVGYSTIWIARSLPEGGKVYSFEREEKTAKVAKENINNSDVADKVEILVGDAHAKLKEIENHGPFDAIFIDAEKQGYCKYLDWAEKNLRKGGLIIGDNTFLFGLVYNEDESEKKYADSIPVMKEFNQRLADKTKYDGIIIPTVEGLTVAIKKF
jgi:predicted O-methyltransferase YrrM